MSKVLTTAKDGTLLTTLGKVLIKSIKMKASELRDPFLLCGQCKEITFAKVPSDISLYINELKENFRLSIEDKCSIEARINVSWIQVDVNVSDDAEFEIWIWS